MKKIFSFIALLLTISILSGQNTGTRNIEFKELGINLKLTQNSLGEDQYLIINDSEKKIKLEEEFDPYSFRNSFIGDRSFIIIAGRYKYYIFNLYTKRIIGPLRIDPEPGTIAEDAQSGVLYRYKIIKNGQYLLIHALDFGLFCMNLIDLYNPDQLPRLHFESSSYKSKYLFYDCRKDNIYNMIIAYSQNFNSDIEVNKIYPGYRFKQNNDKSLYYKVIDNKYIEFERIINDSLSKRFIINMETGECNNEIK